MQVDTGTKYTIISSKHEIFSISWMENKNMSSA